jgi:hypothetical protein
VTCRISRRVVTHFIGVIAVGFDQFLTLSQTSS